MVPDLVLKFEYEFLERLKVIEQKTNAGCIDGHTDMNKTLCPCCLAIWHYKNKLNRTEYDILRQECIHI